MSIENVDTVPWRVFDDARTLAAEATVPEYSATPTDIDLLSATVSSCCAAHLLNGWSRYGRAWSKISPPHSSTLSLARRPSKGSRGAF